MSAPSPLLHGPAPDLKQIPARAVQDLRTAFSAIDAGLAAMRRTLDLYPGDAALAEAFGGADNAAEVRRLTAILGDAAQDSQLAQAAPTSAPEPTKPELEPDPDPDPDPEAEAKKGKKK